MDPLDDADHDLIILLLGFLAGMCESHGRSLPATKEQYLRLLTHLGVKSPERYWTKRLTRP
jgi:hypothetical protein